MSSRRALGFNALRSCSETPPRCPVEAPALIDLARSRTAERWPAILKSLFLPEWASMDDGVRQDRTNRARPACPVARGAAHRPDGSRPRRVCPPSSSSSGESGTQSDHAPSTCRTAGPLSTKVPRRGIHNPDGGRPRRSFVSLGTCEASTPRRGDPHRGARADCDATGIVAPTLPGGPSEVVVLRPPGSPLPPARQPAVRRGSSGRRGARDSHPPDPPGTVPSRGRRALPAPVQPTGPHTTPHAHLSRDPSIRPVEAPLSSRAAIHPLAPAASPLHLVSCRPENALEITPHANTLRRLAGERSTEPRHGSGCGHASIGKERETGQTRDGWGEASQP